MQLAAIGKPRRPGQRLRFWYVRGKAVVHAWDLQVGVEPALLDIDRYTTLLLRAASAILQPLGIDETELQQILFAEAWQLPLACYQVNPCVFIYELELAVKNRSVA